MENNSKIQNELETGDRERSDRKVRRRKKRRRKDNSNFVSPQVVMSPRIVLCPPGSTDTGL